MVEQGSNFADARHILVIVKRDDKSCCTVLEYQCQCVKTDVDSNDIHHTA